MSPYNRDQLEAITMIRRYMGEPSRGRMSQIKRKIQSYLRFRADVADFQKRDFSVLCTQKCFTSQTSACCGREGIATFFADMVINIFLSSAEEIDSLSQTLIHDLGGLNCVYLTDKGCLWRLKPIVCEMFLCQHAKDTVLGGDETIQSQWEKLCRREKRYTWPSRPVLFDDLEKLFIKKGFDSPLMYFHRSPGLLRVKAQSKIKKTVTF